MKKPILAAILTLILLSLACGQYVTATPTVSPPSSTPSPSSTAPVPTATAKPTEASVPAQDVQTATVRAALVNVRAMPGGEVVGQLGAGQDVEIVECADDWCQIVDPAGWVFQGCLSIADGQGCEAK
jgi:hypothetical protein